MQIHIRDVSRTADGEYELDWLTLTAREKHEIKLISDVRPTEFQEALVTSDAAFIAAVALIALRRADMLVSIDLLLDTEGTIRFVFPELEQKAGGDRPPAQGRRGSKSTASGASGSNSDPS